MDKREQLLKVLRGERQGADGGRFDSLAGGGVGGVDGLDLGLNFDVLLHGLRGQFGDHARGFGDANHNVRKVAGGEPGTLDAHGISSDGEQRGGKGAVGAGFNRALKNFRALVGDAHFGVGDECAAGILHDPGNGAGGAALGDCLR